MPENARFNPRYRPEFQRGYDPEAHDATVERADARITPSGTSPAEAREPNPDPDADAESDGNELGDGVQVGEGDTVAVGPQASAATSRSSLWRNPYIIVLLIVGVLLVAGGLQLYFRSVDWMYGAPGAYGPTPEDMVTLQVLWGLAPVLMTAGMFVLIGVGFFAASRWRSPRSGDPTVQRS